MIRQGFYWTNTIAGFLGSDYPRLGDEITRAGRIASDNFRRIHGFEPHPFMNIYTLIEEYARIPTWEELAAKTADLTQRLDAAKAKHGIA